MKRVFLRFYLGVLVFFLLSALVVGGIYKHVLKENNRRYLADVFQTTLTLIEIELREVPEQQWPQRVANLRQRLDLPIAIETLDRYVLNDEHSRSLIAGGIVLLPERDVYVQRIPKSDSVLTIGPVDYLFFARKLNWIDVLAVLSLALALGVPAFLWLRPLVRHARELSLVSQQLGQGHFSARAHLPDTSPLADLAQAINHMARSMGEMVQTRKTLIDGISHDLRTPIARLRYRLEALRGTTPDPLAQKIMHQIERDLDNLNEMTEELLIFSRLDQPEMSLERHPVAMLPWLEQILAELSWQQAPPAIQNLTGDEDPIAAIDTYYMGRAVMNLVNNARRYGESAVEIRLVQQQAQTQIWVDDDGPGIPAHARETVLRPFARLDEARSRHTGGHGLGLAIVQKVLEGHQGQVLIEDAPLGGARLILSWPTELIEKSALGA